MTSKWKECKLGDVVNLKRGYDLPRSKRQEGNVPVVSSSGITGHHSEAKVRAPGVVTGRYGTLGEIHYIEKDFWPLNTTLYVQDFKGNDPRYVSYLLLTLNFAVQNVAAAVPGVNRNFLHQLSVRVPPLPTQRKIAAILSAYDDLIENNTRRIAVLEEMARLLYREWFVHFRFPGHEQVTMVDSELGPVPEGWEMVTVGDLYRTSSGGTPSRKVNEYFGGSIDWVKTRELRDSFTFETEEKITELGLQKSSAKLFPANTVIMAMYGATIGMLGILASPAATNQACCAILEDTPSFGHSYAFLYLLENRNELINLGMGAAQQNISQRVIKNFKMLKPTTPILRRFNDSVDPIFDYIKVLQSQVANLRRTRDLLLPRLISGEVDVSDLSL
jgi:type I restriction enzyme S subunit